MFKCETCTQFYSWVTIPVNIDSLLFNQAIHELSNDNFL